MIGEGTFNLFMWMIIILLLVNMWYTHKIFKLMEEEHKQKQYNNMADINNQNYQQPNQQMNYENNLNNNPNVNNQNPNQPEQNSNNNNFKR